MSLSSLAAHRWVTADDARPALRAIGAEILFETVSGAPGKPTWRAPRQ